MVSGDPEEMNGHVDAGGSAESKEVGEAGTADEGQGVGLAMSSQHVWKQ